MLWPALNTPGRQKNGPLVRSPFGFGLSFQAAARGAIRAAARVASCFSLTPLFPLLLQQLFNVLQVPPFVDGYDPKHLEHGGFA